jgi:serine/threonine-protein kinase HipA
MNCPGCLREQMGDGYCRKCLKELFDGKRIGPVLSFNSPYTERSTLYTDLATKISISGVQVKFSLKLDGNRLVLTDKGGQYILKPVPTGQFQYLDQAPANEHLTMQLAKRFKLDVPPNALVFFQDGSPAYMVKRFDVRADGTRVQQEDFGQIAQVTEETHGKNYKYDLSYEEVGHLIRQHISMYPVELEKFFRLLVFNYLFSNGDAHVRNFSAYQTEAGDYVLTPVYDLLCTRLHTPGEADLALSLFKGAYTKAHDAYGYYTYHDFFELGKVLGIKVSRVVRILATFKDSHPDVEGLIDRSFLKAEVKDIYRRYYLDRAERLRMVWGDEAG